MKRLVSTLLCVVMLLSVFAGLQLTTASAASGKAHTHTYQQTVTKAALKKNGKIVKQCKVCGKTVKSTIPAVKSVKLSKTSYVYNGKAKKPAVTVKDKKGNVLAKGTDYKVSYAAGRRDSGLYTVKVTLRGNYTGSKTLKFKILPKKVASLKAASVGETSVSLQWNKAATATGYVVYRYDAAANRYTKIKSTKSTTLTVTGLTPATAYAFSVRAYTKTSGGNLYGDYAKVLNVKTKAKSDSPAVPADTAYYKTVQQTLQTKTYTAQVTFEDAPDMTYHISRKGDDYFCTMSVSENGETFSADVYYDSAKKKTYTQIVGVWFEMDDGSMDDMVQTMDIFNLMDLRSPVSVTCSQETVGGKVHQVETLTAQNGDVYKLYFLNGSLVRLGLSQENETVYCKIGSFSGKVGKWDKPLVPIPFSMLAG